MRNNRGSILIITLGFVLVFTLLGFASIYLGTVNSEAADKRRVSEEAFWLAEAGVERAKLVSSQSPIGPLALGSGTYEFGTKSCSTDPDPSLLSCICSYTGSTPNYCIHRWKVDPPSKGIVSGQARTIRAVFSNLPINAVTTTDGISGPGNNTPDCVPGGTADINGTCETIPGMTLLNYFGVNYTNDHAGNISIVNTNASPPASLPFTSYTGGNYAGQTYSGLVVITNDTNQFITAGNITGTTAANPAFLIIDCANPNKCYKSTGNTSFSGIIWVIGNADMSGTPDLNGSLFVQNGGLNGNLSGNNLIEYNEGIVDTTLSIIGGVTLEETTMVSWKEI